MAIFPDLSGAKRISLDIETYDPDLQELGPGEFRTGYIVGVAVGTDDGFREYYPVKHEEGENLDKELVYRYLNEQLGRNQPKLGANLKYDLSFLKKEGVNVAGPTWDVQIAEPLIDETKRVYSLESLAQEYLGESKVTSGIDEECQRRGYKGKSAAHVWRLPSHLVAVYGRGDVDLPLRIFEHQEKILHDQDLWDLFILESKLIPLLVQMRHVGVRIDRNKAESVREEVNTKLNEAKQVLYKLAGRTVKYGSASDLAPVFDSLGITYTRTPKGSASFTRPWLEHHESDLAKAVFECRKLDKFLGTFMDGTILDHLANDSRIHGSFNQLKADESGTVSGRFSGSKPNLQFIPARDPVLGPLIRSMFIPEEGCDWGRADYSQVELRILAHYAIGGGAEDLVREYCANPNLDVHQWGADLVGIPRKKAKTINFGVVYGMGVEKMANELGISSEEAREFIGAYHEKMHFLKNTSNIASKRAMEVGFIYTILKRRRRFTWWEPADFSLSKKVKASKSREQMERTVEAMIEQLKEAKKSGEPVRIPRGGVKRAGTYKAMNALIQGSAADVMKKAMVDCLEVGVFETLAPHITVHDELDVSVPRTKEGTEAFKEMCYTMQDAVKFKVPLLVEAELGQNWGYCEKFPI